MTALIGLGAGSIITLIASGSGVPAVGILLALLPSFLLPLGLSWRGRIYLARAANLGAQNLGIAVTSGLFGSATGVPLLGIGTLATTLNSFGRSERMEKWTWVAVGTVVSAGAQAELFSALLPPLSLGEPITTRLRVLCFLVGTFYVMTLLRTYRLESAIAQTNLRAQLERSDALLEDVRRAEEDAQAASRAKSAFLAQMSHEIRTPAAAVISLLGLADKEAELDAARAWTRRAERSARHLLAVLNDVLEVSKIEAGRLLLCLEPTDVSALMHEAMDMARALRPEGRVQHELELQLAEPWRHCDGLRLRQVALNLLSNATKFTTEGEVRMRVDDHDGRVRIEVSDSGIGMSAEQVARVFEPFVQAEEDTHQRFGGTGLGLTITRRLVEMMEGELQVHSSQGSGTRITLLLPLSVAAPESRPAPAPEVPREARKRRLLVVEDNPINQEIIAALLEHLGHEVSLANDGRAGLLRAQSESYDAILMDIQMPVLDGLGAVRALRAWERDEDRPRLPVIALSANAFVEDEKRSLEAGFDAHLAKPVSEQKLQELLGELP